MNFAASDWIEAESGPSWIVHGLRGDKEDSVRVATEGGSIACVSCDAACLPRGVDLIGMDIEAAARLLGEPAVLEQMEVLDEIQVIHDFEALGLMLWTFDGKVVTVQAIET